MIHTNLDTIARRRLLEKGLPLHWYVEFLTHAASSLRHPAMSIIKPVQTVLKTLNSYFAVDIPDDCEEVLAVSIPVGNLLKPVSKKDSISPLRTTDSTGAFTTYGLQGTGNSSSFLGLSTNWIWNWNTNDFGEPTGRYFGLNGGARSNGYNVIKERNQIQFTETFSSTTVVIVYVGNSQTVDNASQIDQRAVTAIHAYIDWKTSPNASVDRSPEANTFYNQARLLRIALDETGIEDIRNALYQAYKGSIKN